MQFSCERDDTDSVTHIGDYAFYNCNSLTNVTIPDSVTSIGAYAFKNCSSLTSVTIPDSVTSIGEDAFEDCISLTSVTIPDSVMSIGEEAFGGCSSLANVIMMGACPTVGSQAFGDIDSSCIVHLPEGDTTYIVKTGKWQGMTVEWYSLDPEPELYPDGDDPVGGEFSVATVWDAFVHDEASPAPVGTVQVKLAKAKTDKKSGLVTAKATATVQLLGEKKVSLKGNAVVADDGTCTLTAASGANEMELVFCGRSVTGRYNSRRVQGARNIFTSKLAADKTLVSNLARVVTGALNIAWSGGTITASFAAKGKVKIAGTSVNGAKISVNTQAIAGESIVAIPVVVLKGVSLAANIYIASDGSERSIAGLDGARIGRAGELHDGLLFTTGATDETVAMTLKNGKPLIPKANKLKVVNGDLATVADNGNPIALKFTYTPKTGAFKGSFTLFEVAAGKLKKQAATFTGVFIEGIGYGTAVIKKLGLAWPVEVK